MARSRSKKFKITKEVLIIALVIILIAAIVLTTLYFVNRDVFNAIFGIGVEDTLGDAGGSGNAGGGDIPTTEILGDRVEVHFIDVGQGDSILIRLPDGKNMMIDAGGAYLDDNHPDKELGVKDKIINYLKDLNITTLDALLLTHSDRDHSGYMDDVIETFDVKNIFLPDFDGNVNGKDDVPGAIPTKTCGDVYVAARAEKYTNENGELVPAEIIYNVDDVDNIIGADYSIVSYCRSKEHYDTVKDSDAHQLNGVSPITVLEYYGIVVMFTGDGEGEEGDKNNNVEPWFMAKNIDIDVDVLKVGHHGSAAGTTTAFLNYIDPEYAVISCGKGNTYTHPHPDTMGRLESYKDVTPDDDYNGIIRTFRTDLDGDIVLTIGANGGMNFVAENDPPAENVEGGAVATAREVAWFSKERNVSLAA